MTRAVYNPITNIIYRLDNSEVPPDSESYIELSNPINTWPNISPGVTWQVIDGTPTFVDSRTLEQKQSYEWGLIKAKRDQLLAESDWRVIKAVDTGVPLDTAWKVYRQALRDITLQADPFNIVWPEPPTV
jgi:hypothetical protein